MKKLTSILLFLFLAIWVLSGTVGTFGEVMSIDSLRLIYGQPWGSFDHRRYDIERDLVLNPNIDFTLLPPKIGSYDIYQHPDWMEREIRSALINEHYFLYRCRKISKNEYTNFLAEIDMDAKLIDIATSMVQFDWLIDGGSLAEDIKHDEARAKAVSNYVTFLRCTRFARSHLEQSEPAKAYRVINNTGRTLLYAIISGLGYPMGYR